MALGDIVIADRRLYLTADKKRVVEQGDPDAAFLLANPGQDIPKATAKRYGIIGKDDRKRREKGQDKQRKAPVNKASGVSYPPESRRK